MSVEKAEEKMQHVDIGFAISQHNSALAFEYAKDKSRLKFKYALGEFTRQMLIVFDEQLSKGWTGWDNVSDSFDDSLRERIKGNMKNSEDDSKCLVDVANMALMLYSHSEWAIDLVFMPNDDD